MTVPFTRYMPAPGAGSVSRSAPRTATRVIVTGGCTGTRRVRIASGANMLS